MNYRLGENIVNHICNKGLVSRIYKQLSKLNRRNINNLIKNWASYLDRYFPQNTQMANKFMKFKIKYKHKIPLNSMKMATITKQTNKRMKIPQTPVSMWGKGNSHTLLERIQKGTVTLESSLAVSYQVKHTSTISPNNPIPKHLLKRNKNALM